MELIVGYHYTLKKHRKRYTVVLEALTAPDNPNVIVRGTDGVARYVNPKRLRMDKRTTLEAKLCGHRGKTSDLFFAK
jgi:hypothetical protein